jgi:hypothetical protein
MHTIFIHFPGSIIFLGERGVLVTVVCAVSKEREG